ncbi:MAG TPA: hypothetical protein VFI31_01470 [Pirellulales bacterium]|nr:hypothetical protein [Pirellulales bacterium]
MKENKTLEELRTAAADAMTASKGLFEVWRELPVSEVAQCCTQADVGWLRELIIHRIYPVNAFELLAHIDVDSAIEALLDRYLGEAVSPDTKFGGYSFELDTMLDDLVEIAGPDALKRLVQRNGFGRKHLNDRRVTDAFADALNLDAKQWNTWLKSNLTEKVSAKAS